MKFLARFGLLSLVLIMPLAACPKEDQPDHEKKNVEAQQNAMNRATISVPVPPVKHFLARNAVAEYMRRVDVPDKTWFIYERGENGNTVNYYVSSTIPLPTCSFMTPPDQINEVDVMGDNVAVVTTAPALDGIYYARGGCNTMFFFDAETDAIIFTSMRLTVADQPLSLEGEPVQIQLQQSDDSN